MREYLLTGGWEVSENHFRFRAKTAKENRQERNQERKTEVERDHFFPGFLRSLRDSFAFFARNFSPHALGW
jgi:hypothetical protein